MESSTQCVACLIQSATDKIPDDAPSDKQWAYQQAVLKLFTDTAILPAPVYNTQVEKLYREWWGDPQSIYQKAKTEHNRIVMTMAGELEEKVRISEDPLELAFKMARAGNYIDMAAMKNIVIADFKKLLEGTLEETLNPDVYSAVRADLETASHLVYLTDNCGEVVLDRILLRTLRQCYPSLQIDVMVRGEETINDVTLADAKAIGLTEEFNVIGNGSAVAGTYLPDLSKKARNCLESADVIISKGQGNFETLYGCGLNIYYLLLCKCDYFMKKFNVPHLGSIFKKERQ